MAERKPGDGPDNPIVIDGGVPSLDFESDTVWVQLLPLDAVPLDVRAGSEPFLNEAQLQSLTPLLRHDYEWTTLRRDSVVALLREVLYKRAVNGGLL